MNSGVLEKIIKKKDYIIKQEMFNIIKEYKLTLEEFLLLVYFLNQDIPTFDIETISKTINITVNKILDSFTILTNKGLINLNVINEGNKVLEVIDVDYTYKAMVSQIEVNDNKEVKSTNIYETFEKEFSRTLSPMEYELINNWLNQNISEDLIKGALKEAIYNGVTNFRYIDKIIYEWNRKGFKTMDEVNNHLKSRNNTTQTIEIDDLNWLDE